MARIPEYGHRTQAPGPQSQAKASYAGEGQGLQALGSTVSTIGAEIGEQLRREEIARTKRYDVILEETLAQEYEMWAVGRQDELRNKEGFVNPNVVKQYHSEIMEKASEFSQKHTGSDEGRRNLSIRLEKLRGKYAIGSYKQGKQDQDAFLERRVDETIGNIAANAGLTPEMVDGHLATLEAERLRFGTDTPPEIDAKFEKARSQVLGTVIQTYIETGKVREAEALMESERFRQGLEPGQRLEFKIDVAKLRKAEADEFKSIQVMKAKGEAVFGRPWDQLTESERARAGGMSAPGGKPVLEQISEAFEAYKATNGGELPPDASKRIVEHFTHAGDSEGRWGRGLQGRIGENQETFADDVLSGRDVNVNDAFTIITMNTNEAKFTTDDQNNISQVYIPALTPPFLMSLEKLGIPAPANGVSLSGAEFNRVVQETQRLSQEAYRSGPAARSPGIGGSLPAPTAAPVQGGQAPTGGGLAPDPTVLAPNLGNAVGLSNTVERLIFEKSPLEVVGQVAESAGADQKSVARIYSMQVADDIVKLLQTSPTYAQTERKELDKLVNLDSTFFTNKSARQSTLLAWHDILSQKIKEANSILVESQNVVGRKTNAKLTEWAQNMVTLGPPLLKRIGVYRVKSNKDMAAMKYGEIGVWPNGMKVTRLPDQDALLLENPKEKVGPDPSILPIERNQ